MSINSFEGTRAYLVGRKVILENNLEKLNSSKSAFENDCLELMTKIESIMNEGSEKYKAEMNKIKLSIDLHQSMLVSLDEDNDISEVEGFDAKARKELSNLESVINLTDVRVKNLFCQKPKGPCVVKRTEVVAKVEEPKDELVEALKKSQAIEEQKIERNPIPVLFKDMPKIEEPKLNPYPDEYYLKSNGMVNNMFIGERLYEYMHEHKDEMSTKEMCDWVREMFPKSINKWSSIEKGIANIIQQHLKRAGLVMSVGGGIYRLKERA